LLATRSCPAGRVLRRCGGKQMHVAIDNTHGTTLTARVIALNPRPADSGNCAVASHRPSPF
jgi:hypothetical protein